MTADENRRLVEEAVNQSKLDVLDEVADGEMAVAARHRIGPFRDSFPDFRMEIIDLIAEGEKVAAHFRVPAPKSGLGWEMRRPAGTSRMSMRSGDASRCSQFAREGIRFGAAKAPRRGAPRSGFPDQSSS